VSTETFALGTSVGGDYDLTQSTALGAGLASMDELVSEGLKRRLGPMQLRFCQVRLIRPPNLLSVSLY
jgi:hypothetical protein